MESLELPADIVYGAVIVTAMGRGQVLVENYKGIIEYTREKIRLQTKTCQVTIQGKGLLTLQDHECCPCFFQDRLQPFQAPDADAEYVMVFFVFQIPNQYIMIAAQIQKTLRRISGKPDFNISLQIL